MAKVSIAREYVIDLSNDLQVLDVYTLSQRGERGYIVSIPSSYVSELGLEPGRKLAFYRVNGYPDLLVIAPTVEE